MAIEKKQPITDELFKRLELVFASGRQPSTFELRQLEREATNLAKVDASAASLIKAGVAAIQWDAENTRYWVQNACALDRTAVTYLNSALTCKFINDVKSAAEYALKAAAIAVNDTSCIEAAVGYLAMTGEIKRAQQFLAEHDKMGLDLDEVTRQISDMSLAMDELDISSERLCFEMNAAFSLLAKHKIRGSDISPSEEFDPDGGNSLCVGISFLGDLALEMQLEAELAELFVQEPGWNPNTLSVEFRYKSKNVLQLA